MLRRLTILLTFSLLLAACTPEDLQRLFTPAPALQIRLVADTTDPAYSPDALAESARIIERRLGNADIRAGAETNINGEITLTIYSPVEDIDGLLALMTRRGVLEFADLRNAPPDVLINTGGVLVATSAHPVRGGQPDPVTGAPYETVLDAVEVVHASANVSQFGESWDILVRFSPEHGALLSAYTAANTGTAMGILVDGVLLSAPVIQAQIGEEALIAGDFSEAEARNMAAILGGGTLPLGFVVAEMR